jgi:hypothetical protein
VIKTFVLRQPTLLVCLNVGPARRPDRNCMHWCN